MKQTNYYNKIAESYDRTRWLSEPVAAEVVDFILKLVGATPDTAFLEPGVGTGLNVIPLVKRGYPVTGIDISQEMLDRFRQKLGEVPSNLQLIHADASRLLFPDRSFDVGLTVHILHAVADWKVLVNDMMRVLKPNGYYLNCQWITPPARLEFEGYFRGILSKYASSQPSFEQIDVAGYLQTRCESNYYVAKEWR
jgi:ubiquinone/menaquinone biosynthesis C-methylase UbiE